VALTYPLFFGLLAPSDWTDLINAVSHLLEVLVGIFGRTGTVLLLLGVAVGSIIYRRWREHRKAQTTRALIDEKERTIQRLSEENRNYRIVFLQKIAGWSEDQIDRFVMRNEFTDGVAARRTLEGERDEGNK